MKNISKNKKALLFGTAVCTAACIFTAPVSALASPEFARSAEEWARLRDNKLEWDEIDGLVNEYNSVVINNNIDLQDNAGKDAEEIRNDLKRWALKPVDPGTLQILQCMHDFGIKLSRSELSIIESSVDLPTLGIPTRPTSAKTFSSRRIVISSPGSPFSLNFGAGIS